jgi:hypothetical protein
LIIELAANENSSLIRRQALQKTLQDACEFWLFKGVQPTLGSLGPLTIFIEKRGEDWVAVSKFPH